MPTMLPVAGTTPFVVTTDDGTLLHAQPHEVDGDESGPSARWILIDTRHVHHVGPVYDGAVPPQTLQRILSEWWATRGEA